jgi:hypothetical protein
VNVAHPNKTGQRQRSYYLYRRVSKKIRKKTGSRHNILVHAGFVVSTLNEPAFTDIAREAMDGTGLLRVVESFGVAFWPDLLLFFPLFVFIGKIKTI